MEFLLPLAAKIKGGEIADIARPADKATRSRMRWYEQQLVVLYTRYDPGKVGQVQSLLGQRPYGLIAALIAKSLLFPCIQGNTQVRKRYY